MNDGVSQIALTPIGEAESEVLQQRAKELAWKEKALAVLKKSRGPITCKELGHATGVNLRNAALFARGFPRTFAVRDFQKVAGYSDTTTTIDLHPDLRRYVEAGYDV